MSSPTALVKKLSNYCNILREDGLMLVEKMLALTPKLRVAKTDAKKAGDRRFNPQIGRLGKVVRCGRRFGSSRWSSRLRGLLPRSGVVHAGGGTV
ncbi:MAG: hypothetical protein ACKVY0_18405, partial [Prosthecobacter sp.]